MAPQLWSHPHWLSGGAPVLPSLATTPCRARCNCVVDAPGVRRHTRIRSTVTTAIKIRRKRTVRIFHASACTQKPPTAIRFASVQW